MVNTLTSIIVDDEHKSREGLKALIEKFCQNISVSATCQNGDEAVRAIQQYRPDLVFLDIQLQSETGFEILERMGRIEFDIIFTTAYSEFALQAFKVSALDYLLKPIEIAELQKAVEKARQKQLENVSNRLAHASEVIKTNKTEHFKLVIPAGDGLVFLKPAEICFFEASGNYTNIHTSDKSYLVARTLKDYQTLLEGPDFFRIHHAYLVNLNQIKKYIRGDGGQVVLMNDVHLDVSKSKKKSFLDHLKIRE